MSHAKMIEKIDMIDERVLRFIFTFIVAFLLMVIFTDLEYRPRDLLGLSIAFGLLSAFLE